VVIFRFGKMPYLDQSGLYALEDSLVELKQIGIPVLLIDLKEQPRLLMERIDILPDLIPEEHVLSTFQEALDLMGDWVNS